MGQGGCQTSCGYGGRGRDKVKLNTLSSRKSCVYQI